MPRGIYAIQVIDDGSVVVGYGSNELTPAAFLWTSEEGMFELGDLPGGRYNSFAREVSAPVCLGHQLIGPRREVVEMVVPASIGGDRAQFAIDIGVYLRPVQDVSMHRQHAASD